MKSEFDNLRLNNAHSYSSDKESCKEVVKIFRGEQLIAKKRKIGKKTSYFGVKGYEKFLTEDKNKQQA